MNTYYYELMKLRECDDIKEIIRRWNNFSGNRNRVAFRLPVVLPDMLWVARPGYGKTNLLRLLSEYMAEEGLMEFYGEHKFFEFVLNHRSKETFITEIERFNDAVRNAAGFRGEFKGIVCINVDEWLDHLNERNFTEFMDYLSLNTDDWHIIFVTESSNKSKVRQLEAVLSVYFRIEKVVFKMPQTEDLLEYMKVRIGRYGFMLSDGAVDILRGTVNELRGGKYFDGYKTLNIICSDVIYKALSQESFGGYTISKEIASYYSSESEFVKRTKNNMEKRGKIGFDTVGGGFNA